MSLKIRNALYYINSNYCKELKLNHVASFIGVHQVHLCREFKKELGVPFREYILKIRIKEARFLLVQSIKSIKEIGYEVGFSNPEVFSKSFKRQIGLSPKNFRIQLAKTNVKPEKAFLLNTI